MISNLEKNYSLNIFGWIRSKKAVWMIHHTELIVKFIFSTVFATLKYFNISLFITQSFIRLYIYCKSCVEHFYGVFTFFLKVKSLVSICFCNFKRATITILQNNFLKLLLTFSFLGYLFCKLNLSFLLSLSFRHTHRGPPFDPDNLATINPRIMSNALNLKLQK